MKVYIVWAESRSDMDIVNVLTTREDAEDYIMSLGYDVRKGCEWLCRDYDNWCMWIQEAEIGKPETWMEEQLIENRRGC